MTSRSYPRAAAIAAACLAFAVPAAIAAPASASNSSGGSGSSGGSSSGGGSSSSGGAGLGGGTSTPTTATATPVGGPVSASGNGFALSTTSVGTDQRSLAFSGMVASGDASDELAIQMKPAKGAWETVASSTVDANGDFSVDYTPTTSGVVAFRAALQAPPGAASAASAAPASSSPALSVTIYQDAVATIYGPGFYGHKTACGQTLKTTTLGVASRTLKCGTKVSIVYDGKSITVPVIDRGPFANGASWDLTEATAAALGDTDTETIGAAVL